MRNNYITADREAALAEFGITLPDHQILSYLFTVVAQTDDWDRPTLTAETNGEWVACLRSSDAHFTDRHICKANTPENAIADLLLAMIRDMAERGRITPLDEQRKRIQNPAYFEERVYIRATDLIAPAIPPAVKPSRRGRRFAR